MSSSERRPPEVVWALEAATNPSVLRLHTMLELTKRTIVTCPPGTPDAPVDQLLIVPGIRSIDLHRYLVRPQPPPARRRGHGVVHGDGIADAVMGRPVEPSELEPDPRPFPIDYDGPHAVTESAEMAGSRRLLGALFRVHGVAEAILEPGRVVVRPGRLFDWEHLEPRVLAALADPVAR